MITLLKKVIPITMMTCLAGIGHADGMATSNAPFEVIRNGAEAIQTSSAVVSPGDVFTGSESMVQLEFVGGNSVIVDTGSKAAVSGSNHIELVEGALIAGKRGLDAMKVSFSDLLIAPVGAAEDLGTIFVGLLPSGDLQVSVFDGNFSVLAGSALAEVASLGRGDAIRLRRIGDAWTAITDFSMNSLDGLGPIASGALNLDNEGAFFWWWSDPTRIIIGGLGLGALGGITYFILDDDSSSDDDGDDDESRPRFSPISTSTDDDI